MTHAAATPAPDAPPSAPPPPPPAPSRAAAWVVFLGVTLAVLAADLALKSWAFANVAPSPVRLEAWAARQAGVPRHDPITLVPHLLSLQLVLNRGAVFGLGQGGKWVFIPVSIAAAGFILFLFWRSPRHAWPLHAALALILSGALGNLYDRVLYSEVRDMLRLFPTTDVYPWVFNLADAALVVGVAIMLLMSAVGELRQRTTR